MRHIILFLCGILLSIYAFAQNQNTQRIVLTNGTVINGQVEKQADGTYQVITSNNDVFYFLPSEVSRVMGVADENVTNKNATYDSVVERHGNALRYNNSKIPLKQSDFYSPAEWENYLKIQKKGKTGRTLLYSGLAALGSGAIIFGIGMANQTEPLYIGGYAIYMAGLGTGIAGLIVTLSSNSKLKKMANTFNHNPGYVMNFGVQQHGIGFALNF